MLTPSQVLTRQFYEWEQRGRGWYLSDHTVDLEPVFEPFWSHNIREEIIDDGKRPTWLQSLFSGNETDHEQLTLPDKKALIAYAAPARSPLTIFSTVLPKHCKTSIERVEQLLTMLSYRKRPMSFEIIGSIDKIELQWTCTEDDEDFLYTQLQAFFADILVRETYDDAIQALLQDGSALYSLDFGLQEEFMRPLATLSNADNDPYTAFFGILERLADEEQIALQILFSGTHNAWSESIVNAVTDDSGKTSFFYDDPDMPKLAHEKISRPLFAVTIRLVTSCDELSDAFRLLEHSTTAIVHASSSPSNGLLPLAENMQNPKYPIGSRLADILLRETHRTGMLLNSRELATFVHFPALALQSHKVIPTTKTTKAVPGSLIGHRYELGCNTHHGVETIVSLSTEQRLRHVHIMGATGTGKSTLLHSLIAQDIEQGNGIMVIDPHGDLITTILATIPPERIEDVIVIDPSDRDFPVGFNILSAQSELEKELLASDLVALFKRFSTSWGDQMNSVLANAIMAIVYNTHSYHLGDLRKLLIDPSFRTSILRTVTDPDIVYYWQKEFPMLKSGSIGSIITRLDSFLRPKVIRNMVCQNKALDFAQLMDTKKIVLVNLSQGLLGAENSYLLGAFIVSKLQQTAMARQSQDKTSRIPFYCYIDEFQHFTTPSMATILSGARKYGVGLILAHQDMAQVAKYDSDIASSILANAGTRIYFRLGDTDAKRLQEGFSNFTQEDLQNLAIGEAIARVNTTNADFNLDILPNQIDEANDYTEDIISFSRSAYSVSIVQSPPVPIEEFIPQQPKPLLHPTNIQVQPTESPDTKPETQREHRYLQTFLKKTAEEFGYIAHIEVPTPDGTGLVDLLLEKDGKRIAVEISVTTTAQWELHNIQKCLAAGYQKVFVCSKSIDKLQAIKKLNALSAVGEDIDKVFFVSPDQFQSLLTPEKAKDNTTVIKGYRVKVQYDKEGVNKQNLLESIINTSQKR